MAWMRSASASVFELDAAGLEVHDLSPPSAREEERQEDGPIASTLGCLRHERQEPPDLVCCVARPIDGLWRGRSTLVLGFDAHEPYPDQEAVVRGQAGDVGAACRRR